MNSRLVSIDMALFQPVPCSLGLSISSHLFRLFIAFLNLSADGL
jgi:hypothetical protein